MSVTVVVPTCNRSAFVRDVVSALQGQTHGDFNGVLVDDGSVDDTAAVARAVTDADPRFTVLSTPNHGPASARNAGCAAVSTEWIAFTDDDCLPQSGWLAALLGEAERTGADVVQGCTLPDPTVDRARLSWYSRSQRIESWSGRFQTCNLLVRAARREVGGFDESFPPDGFGEDTDLGLRLVRAGATTAFASEGVVHHRILPMGYVEFIRRRYRWAKVVRLVAVNPDSRTVFPYRYVAYRAHLVFWAAVPLLAWALVARRSWPVLVAGVLAFGVVRARGSKDKGRSVVIRTLWGATELPALAAAAIGFLVESARHRRLLL